MSTPAIFHYFSCLCVCVALGGGEVFRFQIVEAPLQPEKVVPVPLLFMHNEEFYFP